MHTQGMPHEYQQPTLTIGQIARLTGVKAKNIRYYESIGLLPDPARSENTYRRYGMADVHRLILLRHIRLMGISLFEARALLIGASDAACATVQQELLPLVHARLSALDQEITALHRLRDDMERYQHTLEACHPDANESFGTCRDMSCIAISNEFGRKE